MRTNIRVMERNRRFLAHLKALLTALALVVLVFGGASLLDRLTPWPGEPVAAVFWPTVAPDQVLARVVAADATAAVVSSPFANIVVVRSSQPGLGWRLLAAGAVPIGMRGSVICR